MGIYRETTVFKHSQFGVYTEGRMCISKKAARACKKKKNLRISIEEIFAFEEKNF